MHRTECASERVCMFASGDTGPLAPFGYLCIHTHVCKCTYTYIYLYVYTYMYVYIYVYICIYTYFGSFTRLCVGAHAMFMVYSSVSSAFTPQFLVGHDAFMCVTCVSLDSVLARMGQVSHMNESFDTMSHATRVDDVFASPPKVLRASIASPPPLMRATPSANSLHSAPMRAYVAIGAKQKIFAAQKSLQRKLRCLRST